MLIKTALQEIRAAELELIRPLVARHARVLELGGGDGFQASVMEAWGAEVVSIDVPGRKKSTTQYFPVQEYDGRHLPFPSASFDVVFTSNVLEHIAWRAEILAEIKRVLRSDGVAIHLVPSATWRLWTSLTHYGVILRYLFGRGDMRHSPEIKAKAHATPWRNILFAPVHGEYRNQIEEWNAYRRAVWLHLFRCNGFDVDAAYGNGLYYSGALLLGGSVTLRHRLASLLGSSCHVFVLRGH